MREMIVPKLMQDLQIDERGYPIPYFVPFVNGKPNFKYQDAKKKEICRKYMKCHICGNRLFDKSFWFICGPLGYLNHVSSDEAMHEDCARFSMKYCPHLVNLKAERKVTEGALGGQLYYKPDRLFLVKADKLFFIGSVHTKFRIKETHSFHYVENKLVPL